MLVRRITYLDLDDNEITEDFYFNLSKAEIAEMELSQKGGFAQYLQQILDSKDQAQIISTFKSIIRMTVGRRSADAKSFLKSQEITDAFMQSNAYSVLFMELLTDASRAAEFIRGVVPSDISSKIDIDAIVANVKVSDSNVDTVELPGKTLTTIERKPEDYSVQELLDLTDEQFDKLVGTDPRKMTKEVLVVAMTRRSRS